MNDINLPVNHILSYFPPCLRKIIHEVLVDGKVGISSMNIKISLFPSKVPQEGNVSYRDHFMLEIPFGGKELHWEVLFNDEDFHLAPDFDLNDDHFLIDPDVDVIENEIPSLANWNLKDSKSLVSVIREFILLFKKHQLERLQNEAKFARLFTEYSLLTCDSGISENDVEVYVDKLDAVHFLILISVDFSSLPNYVQPVDSNKLLNPSEDTATLKVSFLKPDASRVQTSLQLSPRLEQVIGNSGGFQIPCYTKECSMVEFVPRVPKILEDKIQQISFHHRMKIQYISTFLTSYGCNVIEYDSMQFSKATLLFEHENYYCLVSVIVGKKFPNEKPKIVLHSVYNLHNEKPFLDIVDNYPYSPRWQPEEMVKRLTTHLFEVIPQFQRVISKVGRIDSFKDSMYAGEK